MLTKSEYKCIQQDECVYFGCMKPVSVRVCAPVRRLASGIYRIRYRPIRGVQCIPLTLGDSKLTVLIVSQSMLSHMLLVQLVHS